MMLSKISELEKEAHAKSESGCLGKSKYDLEDAGELYIQAAKLCKLNKLEDRVINNFEKAIIIYENLGDDYQLASIYTDLYKFYKNNVKLYDYNIDLAIKHYSILGKLDMVSKLCVEKAEYHVNNISCWEKAYEMSKIADRNVILCLEKLANLYDDYNKVIECYSQLLNIGKYRTEEYKNKLCLSYLAIQDVVAAKKVAHDDNTLTNIIDAISNNDEEQLCTYTIRFTDNWYKKTLDLIISQMNEDDSVL